jgi:hypothetical protein
MNFQRPTHFWLLLLPRGFGQLSTTELVASPSGSFESPIVRYYDRGAFFIPTNEGQGWNFTAVLVPSVSSAFFLSRFRKHRTDGSPKSSTCLRVPPRRLLLHRLHPYGFNPDDCRLPVHGLDHAHAAVRVRDPVLCRPHATAGNFRALGRNSNDSNMTHEDILRLHESIRTWDELMTSLGALGTSLLGTVIGLLSPTRPSLSPLPPAQERVPTSAIPSRELE